MKKEIVKDPIFLSQKSAPAGTEDLQTALDLLDTLTANRDRCVGMAANMIGVSKQIIVFDDHGTPVVMFNPEIVKKSDRYETEEGCLSLTGVRKTYRWRSIKVKYQTEQLQARFKTYTGWTAHPVQRRNVLFAVN